MDETPVTLTTRPDWWHGAACRGLDPDPFFPRRGDNHAVRYAKSVCAGCKVRDACLDDAFAMGETQGVRGGLSESERRYMRHPETRDCPTCGRTISRTGMGSHRAAHMRGITIEVVK